MQEKEHAEMKLSFIDDHSQQMKGILRYTIYKNGIPIEDVEEQNLIVTVGRTQMAHLLAGDLTGKQITKIAFGTNGAAPALADTLITNPFNKNLLGFTYPAAGQVKFDWNLTTAEANGKAILEFGLICEDMTLFSRRIRESGKPINKESDISLGGDWTIIF
ncbi:MAG: hypothetical protein LBQ88_11390 [Treponema sp.]|jgi:hypothetical protein|nr:hypothetical protein [Treponema sp.]